MADTKPAKKIQIHIETMAAMLLLIVLTSLTVLLIFSTGRAYRSIVAAGSASQEIRTGFSFISTKVRQGDSGGSVTVRPSQWGNALVVTQTDLGKPYEDWIFYYKGTLREALIPAGTTINPAACQVISSLSSFSALQNGRQILITAAAQTAKSDGAGGLQSLVLTLRS
ncbi:MAG: DUF4860 domain-containing protein [Clostridia bacterium]|nr:DUF4860 domain-containing protein [Clostridia bacterium]MDR3645514.1 DUF4860 domain-containing protein [Clostridia bacterium]